MTQENEKPSSSQLSQEQIDLIFAPYFLLFEEEPLRQRIPKIIEDTKLSPDHCDAIFKYMNDLISESCKNNPRHFQLFFQNILPQYLVLEDSDLRDRAKIYTNMLLAGEGFNEIIDDITTPFSHGSYKDSGNYQEFNILPNTEIFNDAIRDLLVSKELSPEDYSFDLSKFITLKPSAYFAELAELRDTVEKKCGENWEEFRINKYFPAIFEQILNELDCDDIEEIKNPRLFLKCYLRALDKQGRDDFCQKYELTQNSIFNSISGKDSKIRAFHANKRLMISEYFKELLEFDPEQIEQISELFSIPTQDKVLKIDNFFESLEVWTDIVGVSKVDFAASIPGVSVIASENMFIGWQRGNKLNEYIDRICDFIRDKTSSNESLPKFDQVAEEQFRKLALVAIEASVIRNPTTKLAKSMRAKGFNFNLDDHGDSLKL